MIEHKPMKNILFTILFLQSMNALACLGEAQMSATADRVQMTSAGQCHVTFHESTITHFAGNMMCPLDLMDVLDEGVEVKNCKLKPGSPVSGVIVRTQSGLLVLE